MADGDVKGGGILAVRPREPRDPAGTALAEFTSARSQLLNQSPELVDC